MAIRGILFDNDGTLVDTHDIILASMRHTMQAFRDVLPPQTMPQGELPPDDVLMAGVGTPLDDQMLVFAGGDWQLAADMLRVYREHNHAHHDAAVKAFPGVVEGLRELREAGFALGVVTAKRHALAQRGLEIVGAWPYLACLIGPDDCARSKPAPDSIIMGADSLGVPSEQCIYLGDSPYDIQAGRAAGCVTVAALWGMFCADELQAEGPAHACASFGDFVELAKSLA